MHLSRMASFAFVLTPVSTCLLGVAVVSTGCANHRVPLALEVYHPPEPPPTAELRADGAPPRDLDRWIEATWASHPQLLAARSRWAAVLAQWPQARAWPKPRLTVGWFLQEIETRVGPQNARIGWSQTAPTAGKLGVRESIVEARALAAEADYHAKARELALEVRKLFWDFGYVQEAIRVTRESQELARLGERIAQTRFENGEPFTEVLRAQAELGAIESQLLGLQRQRDSLLERLRGLASIEEGPTPIQPQPRPFQAPDRYGTSIQGAPAMLAARAREIAAQRGVELARRERIPDVTFGLDYFVTGSGEGRTADRGRDAALASASVSLPLWRDAERARVEQAERLAAAHGAETEALRIDLETRLQLAFIAYEDAERRRDLAEASLVPLGQSALEVALENYRNGLSSFEDWLATGRAFLNVQLDAQRALADREKARVEIESLTEPIDGASSAEGQFAVEAATDGGEGQ